MTRGTLDQRQFPRINVNCDIAIRDWAGGSFGATTENLGIGGACVHLARPLDKLSRIHLRLTLKAGEPVIECEGRVVWAVSTRHPKTKKIIYDTGIQFLDISEESRARILAFIS